MIDSRRVGRRSFDHESLAEANGGGQRRMNCRALPFDKGYYEIQGRSDQSDRTSSVYEEK